MHRLISRKPIHRILQEPSEGKHQLKRVLGPVNLISLGIGVSSHGGDGASVRTFATRLRLRSAKQPDVYLLSCGQWAYPAEGQHVSIREIRGVLGKIFTMQLAPRKP